MGVFARECVLCICMFARAHVRAVYVANARVYVYVCMRVFARVRMRV